METTARARTVLVVGATGHLGSKVAHCAQQRGHGVRALVRPGSDAQRLVEHGIEVVTGDLLDPASLERALVGCSAVLSTAIGYANRKKGDFRSATDTLGNQNLIDAARTAGVERLVLCSVLTCDRAPAVPHFWNKKLAEDYLEQSGLPFVALQPGAFLDQGARDFWAAGLRQGTLRGLIDAAVPMTFLHSEELAGYLVRSLDLELDGKALRIPIGSDRAVSLLELARIMSEQLGREIRTQVPPWCLVRAGLTLAGAFDPWQRDLLSMLRYFRAGGYVADTSAQRHYFGEVPRIEDGVRRYLEEAALLRLEGTRVVPTPARHGGTAAPRTD